MSTTVTYKGNTLTTINNATKKLNTKGKYMEDDVTITDTSSSSASAVSIVDELDSHGGTIRHITSNIVVSGTKTITTNGTHDVTNYTTAEVNVGGGSITDGTEVLERETTGTLLRPTKIAHYGNIIYPSQYASAGTNDGFTYYVTESIIFKDTITEIKNNAFYQFGMQATSCDLAIPETVTSIGTDAFRGSGIVSAIFPVAVTSIGKWVFCDVAKCTTIKLPGVTSLPGTSTSTSAITGTLNSLTSVEVGSVGHTVTSIGTYGINCQNSGLTITVYTTGDKVDELLTNIRTRATAATVIFKASEATTYNSNSYAADATMLTSTV